MGKLANLILGEGDFTQGFGVTLQIFTYEGVLLCQTVGRLPSCRDIPECHSQWQDAYRRLGAAVRLDVSIPQVTNVSLPQLLNECELCVQALKVKLDSWYDDSQFSHIKEMLLQHLTPNEEIRLIIQTQDINLQRLPWQLFFERFLWNYPLAEVANGSNNYTSVTNTPPARSKIRILAILGFRQGLDIDTDRRLLENLRHHGAELVFLVSPQVEQLSQQLWDERGWDMLFFAGHSSSDMSGESGWIEINNSQRLTIEQIKHGLGHAIKHGLQLAIFNSCDGLGLARCLTDLQIGQIIVMREPVPDSVAQKFLQHFLEAFVRHDSSYLALREARQRLEAVEPHFPGATLLPVMCQNPAATPVYWSRWRSRSGASVTSKNFKNNALEQLLENVNTEVENRLASSLHRAVLINLAKEKQYSQVKRPWDVEVKIGYEKATLLPLNTSIIEVFDNKQVAGQLLILGAPGSGKTTTLLELARELIFRAQTIPNQPIPILLNLSSWKDNRQSLADWLAGELKLKYGVRVDIGFKWLKNGQLLPLLDGLDELESKRLVLCIEAINQWKHDFKPKYLVVCSRLLEYELCHRQLQLQAAIRLLPLTEIQIREYLLSAELKQLWQSIQDAPSLIEMATSPLLLSIITLTFDFEAISEWQKFSSDQERLQYLFDAYIEQMLSRQIQQRWYTHQNQPMAKQTLHWLSWLAKKLKNESQTEFLIEKMQPSVLLTRTSLRLYLFGVGLIFCVIVWLGNELPFVLSKLIYGNSHGLKYGLTIMLLTGLFNAVTATLNPRLINVLLAGSLLLPIAASLFVPIGTHIVQEISYQIFTLIVGERSNLWTNPWSDKLIFGLFLALVGGTISELSKKIRIVETLKWSRINVRSGLMFGLIFGLIFGLSTSVGGDSPLEVLIIKLRLGLIFGLMFGLIGTLIGGLSSPDIEKKFFPNQGIWNCAANAIIFALISTLIYGLIWGLNFEITFDLPTENSKGLAIWLLGYLVGVVLFCGYTGGLVLGLACIQHFTLRLILWLNGSIPWNYVRFLNYATNRMFLQRVGGRYRFIHEKLREHFAQMSLRD